MVKDIESDDLGLAPPLDRAVPPRLACDRQKAISDGRLEEEHLSPGCFESRECGGDVGVGMVDFSGNGVEVAEDGHEEGVVVYHRCLSVNDVLR